MSRLLRRGRDDERGVTLILFALMLTVLLVFVALALDTGLLTNERRQDQSAIDSAVLAAAQILLENSNATNAAVDAIIETSWENTRTTNGASLAAWRARWTSCTGTAPSGFTDNNPPIAGSWATDCIAFKNLGPSSFTQVWAKLPPITVTSTFGAVVGIDDYQSTAEAIGEIAPSTKSYGVFALSDTCHGGLGPTLEFADDTRFAGSSAGHSNGDIFITAPSNAVDVAEPLTYMVGFDSLPPLDPTDPPRKQLLVRPPHPLPSISIDDYRNFGRKTTSNRYVATDQVIDENWLRANANYQDDGTFRDRIYFTTAHIELPNMSGRGTFVTTGSIKLLGTLYDMRSSRGEGQVDRVVLLADGGTPSACTDVDDPPIDGIDFGHSFGRWRGVIYAPKGTVAMGIGTGTEIDEQKTIEGMLVANKLDLDGSNYRFDSSGFTSPGPRGVRLYR